MFRSFRARAIGQGLAMALLAIVCVGYSLSAEMQLMARGRSDAIAERVDQSDRAKQARNARDRIRAEIDKLPPARSNAEIAPLIRSARVLAKDCTKIETATQRDACTRLPSLESEGARAERIEELTTRLTTAEADLAAVATSKDADPGALALASYLGALGVTARPDRLGDWIVLIGVLALEIGSALSLSLLNSTGGPTRNDRGVAATPMKIPDAMPPIEKPAPQPIPTTVPPIAAVPINPAPMPPPAPDALAKLRAIAKGDRIEATQEEIGAVLGTSKTTAHRVLRDLATAGSVRLTTNSKGTVVEFA